MYNFTVYSDIQWTVYDCVNERRGLLCVYRLYCTRPSANDPQESELQCTPVYSVFFPSKNATGKSRINRCPLWLED